MQLTWLKNSNWGKKCTTYKFQAQQFDLDVILQNDFHLFRLTRSQNEKERCTKKHRDPVATSETGVLYEIPVACDQVYISQIGCCFNEGAAQHKRHVNT